MQNELYALTYFSRNAIKGCDNDVEIERILIGARRNNTLQMVSGALLYSTGCFAQALEGPRDAIEDVFEIIQRDQRHCDVTVLHVKPIEARSFGKWSMAYAGATEPGIMTLETSDVMESLDSIHSSKLGQELISVLRGTIAKYEMGKL